MKNWDSNIYNLLHKTDNHIPIKNNHKLITFRNLIEDSYHVVGNIYSRCAKQLFNLKDNLFSIKYYYPRGKYCFFSNYRITYKLYL